MPLCRCVRTASAGVRADNASDVVFEYSLPDKNSKDYGTIYGTPAVAEGLVYFVVEHSVKSAPFFLTDSQLVAVSLSTQQVVFEFAGGPECTAIGRHAGA